MRIGELARRAGTTTRALRFYESQGLLDVRRGANGYREYTEHDLRLVEEILTLRTAGFSLDETRPFVACLRAGNDAGDACPSSVRVYLRKLDEVDTCLARMQEMRADLLAKLTAAMNTQPGPCRVAGEFTTADRETEES